MTTLAEIIECLGQTYKDGGIALWLYLRDVDGEPAIYACATESGRAKVLERAQSLTGMIAT